MTQNQIAESDYVKVRLRSQIEKCVETLALAVKSHVTAEMGTFQLMGVDLLVCEDLNIHLLEVEPYTPGPNPHGLCWWLTTDFLLHLLY